MIDQNEAGAVEKNEVKISFQFDLKKRLFWRWWLIGVSLQAWKLASQIFS